MSLRRTGDPPMPGVGPVVDMERAREIADGHLSGALNTGDMPRLPGLFCADCRRVARPGLDGTYRREPASQIERALPLEATLVDAIDPRPVRDQARPAKGVKL